MPIQTLPMTGQTVRAAMHAKRISQRELAACLDLSQAAVHRRLAGEVDFSVSEISAAATALGTTVSDLLTPAEVVAAGDSFMRPHE